MPRFVILWHELPADADRPSHFDLMIETGDALATWELASPLDPASTQTVRRLPDHRLAYLDYEGPISQNRGHVTRWDGGECVVSALDDIQVIADLSGNKVLGHIVLKRDAPGTDRWLLAWQPTSPS